MLHRVIVLTPPSASTQPRLTVKMTCPDAYDRVAFAHEGEQPFQFGPPCVLARRLVGEHFIHLDLFELPFWVLVEAADADVTDALTVQGILLREMCQEEIYDP